MSEQMTAAEIAATAHGATDGEIDRAEVERMILRHMEHHRARAVTAEREACAKIAEARAQEGEYNTWQAQEGSIIAEQIRARSTLKE